MIPLKTNPSPKYHRAGTAKWTCIEDSKAVKLWNEDMNRDGKAWPAELLTGKFDYYGVVVG